MTTATHDLPAVPMLSRLSERTVLLAVCVLVAGVAVFTVTPWPVGAFQDDAMYTVLAKSLAEGKGFRFLNLPGEPNATHFPPGYPLLLALLWKVWPSFPDNLVLFKFANAGCLAAAAAGAWTLVRRHFQGSVSAAAAVALIGTLSIVVLLVTGVVMSEPLFMALLFPTLLAGERAVDEGTWRRALMAGGWVGALTLVRTIGFVAIPAIGLALVLKRRWIPAAVFGATAVALLIPWQLWVSAHQGEVPAVMVGKFGSYGGWLVDGYRQGGWAFARDVIAVNARDLHAMVSFHAMPVQAAWPRAAAMGIVVALAVLGTKRCYRNAPASALFLGLYTLVVMLWPFEPARFMLAIWPLWPLLLGCGVAAAWHLAGRTRARLVLRPLVALAVVSVGAGAAWYNVTGYRKEWWASVQRDAGNRARPVIEWAVKYTKPTDVLATEDDLMVYLYAGRQAVPTSTFIASQRVRQLTDAEDLGWVRQIFEAYQPGWYLVGSNQGFRTAATLAAGNSAQLRYVGRTPAVLIYERTPN